MNISTKKPIIILGILHRSGTNFLWDILQCHTDVITSKITEDSALEECQPLLTFTENISKLWSPNWDIDPEEERRRLLSHLGNGIISFLSDNDSSTKRLAIKTPSVRNMEYAFDLFPDGNVIIVIRDGRDLIESLMKSFNRSFESSLQRWARNAKIILNHINANDKNKSQYLIVKFEDLHQETTKEISRILNFLSLNPDLLNLEKALNLPVRGSSSVVENNDKVHWSPVAKDQSFQPIGKWNKWSWYRKQRFYWVAGKLMVKFNYISDEQLQKEVSMLASPINLSLDIIIFLLHPFYRLLTKLMSYK